MKMYKVVTKGLPFEVWGLYENKEKAEARIKEGYHHRHMYEKDKHKELIVIEVDKKATRK